MIEISRHKANLYCISSQCLTEETWSDDILKIIRQIIGLHATCPATPHLSLFNRMNNYSREMLDDLLYIRRQAAKIKCFRKTIFIIPADYIAIAFAATHQILATTAERFKKYVGISISEYDKISKQVVDLLDPGGLTTKQIKAELPQNERISAIINLMCDLCILVRGKSNSGWKSNLHTYYNFRKYFPQVDLDNLSAQEAREMTVLDYLAAFGPVSQADIAWWTGFPKTSIRLILEKYRDTITEIKIKDIDIRLFILTKHLESLVSASRSETVNINLLPVLDPYTMGYKDRDRYIDKKHYYYIFDKSGNGTSVILYNGIVIGVWDIIEKPSPCIKLYFTEKPGKDVKEKTLARAAASGRFYTGADPEIVICSSMHPLPEGTAGSFLSPLKDAR